MTDSNQKDIKIIIQDYDSRSVISIIGIILFGMISFPIIMSEYNHNYFQILSVFIITYCSTKLIYFFQAKKYKKTKVKINDFHLIKQKRYDEESNIPSIDYEVCIDYTYEFNGIKYNSKKVGIDRSQYYFKQKFSFTDDDKAKTDSLNYLNHFVKIPELFVYVNTLYPKESALDVNVSKGVIALHISYIIITISIYFLLFIL